MLAAGASMSTAHLEMDETLMEFLMRNSTPAILFGVLLTASMPVFADHRDGFVGDHREGHWEGRWEGHEIHRFGERDLHIWRRGHWRHGVHDGRLGWWWVAAGVWYFYPAPVYPYPDPYTPPVVVIDQPPRVVAPQPIVQAQPQQMPQTWYYCSSAKGYYPYVPSCPEGWQTVPAQAPQPAEQPSQPAAQAPQPAPR